MKNLTYKSIDVMKKSKDTLTSQLSTEEKIALIKTLATTGITHVAISVPLDDNSIWVAAGSTPSPRSVEQETMDWCDIIHAQQSVWGKPLNVIHRGSFGGVENIFGVAFDNAATPRGSAASSSTDGNTTWCGKYYRYLNLHVGTHVLTGDIFAPIPEGTTHAFDGHMFVDNTGSGTIANYAQLFADFHTITTTYATAKGVTLTFMSHNNFSEVASGWLPGSIFSDQGIVGFDYYGARQGAAYVNARDYIYDLTQIANGKDPSGGGGNNAGGKQMFYGEWGDVPGTIPTISPARSVTCTNASPAVITLTAHGFEQGRPFSFSGSLPGNVGSGQYYYADIIDANTFHAYTNLGDALAKSGSNILNTSSTGSGLTLNTYSQADWDAFLLNYYKQIRDNLVTPNGGTTNLVGFNNWGGWEGQNTSLLIKTGSGPSATYALNFRGKILQEFFLNDGAFRAPKITSGNSADTYTY